MNDRVNDWRHAVTDRLWLDEPVSADLEDLHRIHADPESWTHFPQGRHVDLARTQQTLDKSEVEWAHGLGYWCVRDTEGGPVVGMAGCAVVPDRPWWNLYYRFASSAQGRGYAVEVGREALDAAWDVDPGRPVMAYLLEHNVGSRRTAERLGLRLVWRGPDDGNPDPAAVRLVYLDREPGDLLVAAMAAAAMPESGLIRT